MIRGLTAADIFDIWERGHDLGGTERALLMLAAATPDQTPAMLAALSVGTMNRLLLELRARTFGERIDGLVQCPACGETLDVSFWIGGLGGNATSVNGSGSPGSSWTALESGRDEVHFRLPTAADLVAIERLADQVEARLMLVTRCIEVGTRGSRRSTANVPARIVREVAARMAAADPDAMLDVEVTCPACLGGHLVALDIAAYLWSELETLGTRLVREVQVLASAFGWGEAEILALPERRRNSYLELVGA